MSVALRTYQRQLDKLISSRSSLDDEERQSFLYYLEKDEVDALYRLIAEIRTTDTIAGQRNDPTLLSSYALAASYSSILNDVAPKLRSMEDCGDRALRGELTALLDEHKALPDEAKRWLSYPCEPVTSLVDLPRLIAAPEDQEWPFFVDPERKAFIAIFAGKLTKAAT